MYKVEFTAVYSEGIITDSLFFAELDEAMKYAKMKEELEEAVIKLTVYKVVHEFKK